MQNGLTTTGVEILWESVNLFYIWDSSDSIYKDLWMIPCYFQWKQCISIHPLEIIAWLPERNVDMQLQQAID